MPDDGVEKGVLYLDDDVIPWNGLVLVEEKDDGTLDVDNYFDGIRFRITRDLGHYSASVEAVTYPPEFEEYTGQDLYLSGQIPKKFGFSYKSNHGDNVRLHVVYNAVARPSNRAAKTNAVNPGVEPFVWDIATTPADVPGSNPTSHLMVDYETARYPLAVQELEELLYGTLTTDPRLPTPEEVYELFESHTIFRVVYNGDGTFTATGPDEWMSVDANGVYTINAPSTYPIDSIHNRLSSY